MNHAMVAVGYNATAGVGSPDSYWIIRNSWGLWGDKGYVKVGANVAWQRLASSVHDTWVPLTAHQTDR